jgi:hypothetical protein
MSDAAFLIRKDALGWKIAQLAEGDNYDGTIFTLASGEKVGKEQGWLADPENLQAIASHQKLRHPEDMTLPELNERELINFLRKVGWCVDHEMRVRRFMGDPFVQLETWMVPALVGIHLQTSGKEEAALKSTLTIGWFDGKVGVITQQGVGVLPERETMPEGMDLGEIVLFRDRMDRERVMLKWRDFYLVPKTQVEGRPVCVLEMTKWVEESRLKPTGTASVKELVGKDWFLTPEGLLISKKKFLTTISFADFSVDELLKGGA